MSDASRESHETIPSRGRPAAGNRRSRELWEPHGRWARPALGNAEQR